MSGYKIGFWGALFLAIVASLAGARTDAAIFMAATLIILAMGRRP